MLMSASLLCCSCCSLTEESECVSGAPSELDTDASAGQVSRGLGGLAGVQGGFMGRSVTPSPCCCWEDDAGCSDGAVVGTVFLTEARLCRSQFDYAENMVCKDAQQETEEEVEGDRTHAPLGVGEAGDSESGETDIVSPLSCQCMAE